MPQAFKVILTPTQKETALPWTVVCRGPSDSVPSRPEPAVFSKLRRLLPISNRTVGLSWIFNSASCH